MGPFFLHSFLGCATGFIFLAGLLATAYGVGAVVLRAIMAPRDWLEVLLALAVGFWLLAVGGLAVGAVSIAAVPLVFAGALCWLTRAPREYLRAAWSTARKQSQPLDSWSKVALILVAVAAVVTLPGVLAPPLDYDELEYHLGALAEYQRAGRIVFLSHNFYSNMPQLTEMLYLLAVITTSDISAKLVHWMFGLLSAFGVYAVGTRLWTRRVGSVAAMLFYCAPFIENLNQLSQTARIDWATTFFATLAMGALLVWMDDDTGRSGNVAPAKNGWLWLSAIAAGGAVATKWTAIPVVLLPAVVCIVVVRKSFFLSSVYCLWAAICVLPWMLKNLGFTGNPVYPLFYGVFRSGHWSTAQAALFARIHYAQFGWSDWRQLGELIWQYSMTDPFGAPLLLMTAPLILLLKRTAPSARRTLWLFVAAYAGWFFLTYRPWRFLLPVLPLAAMTGAWALQALERGKLMKMMMRTALLVVAGVSITPLVTTSLVDAEDNRRFPPRMNFLQYVLGQVSREEFIKRMGGGMYEPILWMNEHLPATAKVLYIGEVRTYYARHAVLWSTMFDQPPLELMLQQAHDDRSLLKAMRALQLTHVYINGVELARLRKSYGYLAGVDPAWLSAFLNAHARPVHINGPCTVYELREAQ